MKTEMGAPTELDDYHAAIWELVQRANAQGEVGTLLEALTWALGNALFAFGRPDVTARVLGSIARHMQSAAEFQQAIDELAEIRDAGRLPS